MLRFIARYLYGDSKLGIREHPEVRRINNHNNIFNIQNNDDEANID